MNSICKWFFPMSLLAALGGLRNIHKGGVTILADCLQALSELSWPS